MAQNIIIRQSKYSDRFKIADLMSIASSHLRPTSYWDWMNNNDVFPESMVYIAEVEDKIIGHYAISQHEYTYCGKVLDIGVATQTVIHPHFRNLNVLMSLSESIKDFATDNDMDVVIGFPNDSLCDINRKLLGWVDIASIYQYESNICKLETLDDHDGINIVRSKEFSSDFSEFLSSIYARNKKNILPSLSYQVLNWRYVLHPLNNYVIFTAYNDNYNICGFIVLKLYHHNKKIKGHIMDFYFHEDKVFDSLFNTAVLYFKWAMCDSISLWTNENSEISSKLENLGFEYNNQKSNFQYLDVAASNYNFKNISEWFIRMGMSDAY